VRTVDLVEEDKKVLEAANKCFGSRNILSRAGLSRCLPCVKCKSGIMGLLEEMNNLKGKGLLNCKVRLTQSQFVL